MNPNLQEVLQSRIVVRSHQAGGAHFIDLMHNGSVYFAFGPYIHPGIARREADRLREFIALILEPAHKAATMSEPALSEEGGQKTHTTLVTKNGAVDELPVDAGAADVGHGA